MDLMDKGRKSLMNTLSTLNLPFVSGEGLRSKFAVNYWQLRIQSKR